MAKKNEVANVVSADIMAELKSSFPVETSFNRVRLPRIGFYSQDQTEGKGKAMKVIAEAGTFYISKPSKEKGEDGKEEWKNEEIGTEIDVIILFQRKQLRMYDQATEKFTSSPVYDSDDEVVRLFCEKKQVGHGTPAELKAEYEYEDEEGKIKSKLEDTRVLYVLYEGEVYEVSIRGSSMYAYLTYGRNLNTKEGLSPSLVLTHITSEYKEKGKISWNQLVFENARLINAEEADIVVEKVREIKEGVAAEKAFFASQNARSSKAKKEDEEADEEFERVTSKASKDF